MSVHIVKRNPNFVDVDFLENKPQIGSISQSALGKKPVGWNANVGDEVWIHEVGYGITKSGKIIHKIDDVINIERSNFNSLMKLYNSTLTKIKDRSYWWDLIQKMLDSPNKDLKYIEYEIEYSYLPEPIPCRFMFQGGWYTLNKSDLKLFESDKTKSFLDLSKEKGDIEILKNIPTKVKFEIFKKLKLTKSDKLVIDFDHIIPKYVGGLGCFTENVQPLPKAVNRSKNKSVPTILFTVAKEYADLNKIVIAYQKIIKSSLDEFSQDKQILILAKKIMQITHTWNMNSQRDFYKKILEKYDYSYFKIISS